MNHRLSRWIGYIVTASILVLSFWAFVTSLEPNAEAREVGRYAAIAGLLTAFNASFRFEARANWFHARLRALRRLNRKLLFAGDNEAEIAIIARELDDLLDKLSEDYPALGAGEFKPLPTGRNQDGG